jgi:hypothetical protein
MLSIFEEFYITYGITLKKTRKKNPDAILFGYKEKRSSNKPREALHTFLATHHILCLLFFPINLSTSRYHIERGRQERKTEREERDAVTQELLLCMK